MTATPRILIYGDFLHDGTEIERAEQLQAKQRFLVAPRCLSLEEPRTAANSLTFIVKIDNPNSNVIAFLPPESTLGDPLHTAFEYYQGDSWHDFGSHSISSTQFQAGIVCRFTGTREALSPAKGYLIHIALLEDIEAGKPVLEASFSIILTPFIILSSLDPVSEVLVVKNKLTEKFVAELEPIVIRAGAKLRPLEFTTEAPWDVWMQDCIEIGGYSSPGKDTPQFTPAFLPGIRGLHDGIETKTLDAEAVKALQKLGMHPAVNLTPRPHTRWIDWYGNLEVSPPVKSRSGKDYPLGRVLYGKQSEIAMHPDIIAFLEQQGIQTPALAVNTSWLTIGHVDEVVNFVPARDRKRFRVLLPSPALAAHLLEQAVAHGHGNALVFPGKKEQVSVAKLLETVGHSEESKQIQAAVDATQAQLKEELGLDDADFVLMPVLFEKGLAVIPNSVNGLVVNGHYIVPAPCGPEIAGKDIWAESIRTALIKLGVTLHFVDIWEPYHSRSGEIHCGTNAIRRPDRVDWWRLTHSRKSGAFRR